MVLFIVANGIFAVNGSINSSEWYLFLVVNDFAVNGIKQTYKSFCTEGCMGIRDLKLNHVLHPYYQQEMILYKSHFYIIPFL